MSRKISLVALTIAVLIVFEEVVVAESVTVSLGGLRSVRAKIETIDDEYRVEIRMLPVTSFDVATNERLNREKARAFALQALAKHLNAGNGARLLVSGARTTASGMHVPEFRLTLIVPRGGVAIERGPIASSQAAVAADRVQFSDTFFTVKRDYLHTLKLLAVGWEARLKGNTDKKGDDFAHAIAQIEEEELDQLGRLRQEIASNKLLLPAEHDELFKAIEDCNSAWTQCLKQAVRHHDAMSKFSDVKLEKPFDAYLLAQPLLMEVTGAKIIRVANGQVAIVGVASTVLKDGSASDRLRAERVCASKARAAIIGEQHGVQVAHVEQAKDRTLIILENGKETGKSVSELLVLTQSKAEGVARGLAPIGRWKSTDGTVFYLAIGGVFDAAGNPILATPP